MKIARVFLKDGRQLTRRSIAQSRHIGQAIEGFILNQETEYSYRNHPLRIVSAKLSWRAWRGLELVKVDFGGTAKYYRIWK